MKHCKFDTPSTALLLILSAPLVGQAQTPVIENATVNLAKSYISLAGSNFSPASVAPTVAVGGTSRTVYSFTNTVIVVEVPSTLATATYLVSVTNSLAHSGSAYVAVGAAGPQGPVGLTGPKVLRALSAPPVHRVRSVRQVPPVLKVRLQRLSCHSPLSRRTNIRRH